MDTNIIIWILAVIFGIVAIASFMRGKKQPILGMNKNVFGFIALLIGGVLVALQLGWLVSVGFAPLSSGISGQVPQAPQAPGQQVLVPVTPSAEQSVVIDTFSVTQLKEKYSNSYSTADGTLRFYDSGTDPKSPTASTIDTITVTNGAGSSTAKKLQTEKPYRVVFDGAGTYYDKDYGIITFATKDYNKNTGQYGFDAGEASAIGVPSVMLKVTDNSTVNGQTTGVIGTDELGISVSIVTNNNITNLSYDKSVGDAQFYIEPTLGADGANTELKEPVFCFEWDVTNPPEGTEISAFTSQLQTGTNFNIPADLLDYWSTQSCISLGSTIGGGTTAKYRLTVTVVEADLNATDIWTLYEDDLGAIRGKDVRLNIGAQPDKITFFTQE